MQSPGDLLPALARRLGRPVRLRWTENRSVYLSLRPDRGAWTLRVHRCFREAPVEIWASMAAFLETGDRGHLGPARTFFEARRPPAARREPILRPRGRVHDLAGVLDAVRPHGPFAALPPVGLTWGRRARPGRRSLRLGSYGVGPPPVIRIHPVLDDPRVPVFVVGQVVHHELVHHLLHHTGGPGEGRRHGARFRELEGRYPQLADALRWQERELPRLVRRARGSGRTG